MNKSRSLKQITILLALFVLFQNEARSQPRAGESVGTVVGSVLDQSGAVILIPRPVIVFRGKEYEKKVAVNENGGFEATLPNGTYELTMEIPGFYPFRRAPFRVVGGASVMLNLVPSRRYLVRGTSVSSKVSVEEAAPPQKYDQIQVTPQSLPALIQFESRQQRGRQVRYRFAVFSYDSITIYADELRFDHKPLRVTASGQGIILENGKQRIEVKGVTVSFDRGEAHIDLVKE